MKTYIPGAEQMGMKGADGSDKVAIGQGLSDFIANLKPDWDEALWNASRVEIDGACFHTRQAYLTDSGSDHVEVVVEGTGYLLPNVTTVVIADGNVLGSWTTPLPNFVTGYGDKVVKF